MKTQSRAIQGAMFHYSWKTNDLQFLQTVAAQLDPKAKPYNSQCPLTSLAQLKIFEEYGVTFHTEVVDALRDDQFDIAVYLYMTRPQSANPFAIFGDAVKKLHCKQ